MATFAKITRKTPDKFINNKWEYVSETFTVEVMAKKDGYAMVRRKGCVPFIEHEKNLVFI